MDELEQTWKRLEELAGEPTVAASRVAVCEAIGQALARLGELLWVTGYIVGSDRVSGASPFRFGDDRMVGVAIVAQIGGELANGAAELLKVGNGYSASALLRQLVEVEYLAFAFENEHEVAAEWLRADRRKRLKFWSPAKLRKRAGGLFLSSDYSRHCEYGGHPTKEGSAFLPGHSPIRPAALWVDLAGHLVRIWWHIVTSAERFLGGPIPAELAVPDPSDVIDKWRSTDGLHAVMGDLNAVLSAEARKESSGD